MSEKVYSAAAVPDISKDGKFIRLLLCDDNGESLTPLIVSTPGMRQIVELLLKALGAAEATQALNASKDIGGFKPTPQMYQVREVDVIRHTQVEAVTLLLQTFESIDLHLVFRPSVLRRLLELAGQAVDTQSPDTDTIN